MRVSLDQEGVRERYDSPAAGIGGSTATACGKGGRDRDSVVHMAGRQEGKSRQAVVPQY